MSLLTVYRVEDDLAKGPYRVQTRHTKDQAEATEGLSDRHSDVRWGWYGERTDETAHLHPGPEQDPRMRNRWKRMDYVNPLRLRAYNFGFESTDRLAQWFFGERDTLELLNMHVAAYTVPHQAVVRGEWQLAFRRPSATLQSTMDLKGLVE